MTIYILNILSLIVWQKLYEWKKEKQETKKVILLGIFLQFVIIEGFRGFSVGADTAKYMEYYNHIKGLDINFFELIVNPPLTFEPGYLLLMKLCAILRFNERLFLLLVTVIFNVLIFRFVYKKSDDFILSIWLFVCAEYFTLSFTMIRQMIAIGFILNAYLYIEKKNLKAFIVNVIVACLFHKTAICFLPIYFILNKDDFMKQEQTTKIDAIYAKYKFWIWLIMTGFIILIIPILFDVFYKIFYPNYNLENSQFNFPTLAVLILVILLLSYFCEKHLEIKEKSFLNFQFCVFCAFLLQVCTFKYLYLFRVALYFYIFIIVLIPSMLKYIENAKFKRILTVGTMLIGLLQYILFSMDIYDMIPYVLGFSV